jgi:membrane peptidoglycan carboxypeptidase
VLEAATLIGMLKGTSYYNPVTNPERSLQRRNIVLGQMAKHGKLTDKQLEVLKKRPMKLDFERQPEALGPAPHLARQLRRFLIDWADRNGYDIFSDGLVVRTTIDWRLQAMANQAVARHGDSLQILASGQWSPRGGFAPNRPVVQALLRDTPQYKAALEAGQTDAQALKTLGADAALMKVLHDEKTRLSAGFMALDPRNGQVRAWVGSRDFVKDQFDHVAQARRQPGSTFKPFVYGAAFEQGMSPGEVLMDEPVEIALGGGQVWSPTDGGEPSYQPMTLRDGLALSKNTITAQVVNRVGAQRVAALARAMGVRQSKLEEVLSLALGTSPVTLREMVASYGTIANGGNYIEPTVILQVEDRDGKVLEAFAAPKPEPALGQPAADRLLDALRGAIDRGTGAAIRGRFGIQADVAGKTGTTQDNTDGWFILMHPHLVAGAWVGFNDSRLTMSDGYGQGARSALPMVGDFFAAALRGKVLDGQVRFNAPQESFAPAEPPPAVVDPGGFSSANGGSAPGFGGGVPAEAFNLFQWHAQMLAFFNQAPNVRKVSALTKLTASHATFSPRAAGAPNAVHIVHRRAGQVVIHHHRQLRNVDAARGQVGGDHHFPAFVLEIPASTCCARALAQFAMKGRGKHAGLVQLFSHHFGGVFGGHKHQHALPALFPTRWRSNWVRRPASTAMAAARWPGCGRGVATSMRTGSRSSARPGPAPRGKVAEKNRFCRCGAAAPAHGSSSSAKPRSSRRSASSSTSSAHGAQLERVVRHQVQQAPGRGHHHVGAAAQAHHLRVDRHAAKHHGHLGRAAAGAAPGCESPRPPGRPARAWAPAPARARRRGARGRPASAAAGAGQRRRFCPSRFGRGPAGRP